MATVDKSRLNALTIKHLLDTLSIDEKNELNAMLDQNPFLRARFSQRVESYHVQQDLLSYLEAEKRRVGRPVPGRRVFLYRYMPYAAAVLLAVGLTVFWTFQHRSRNEQAVTIAGMKQDFLPGSNRATLTLDDGKRIDLEAAGAGTISQQGDIRIFKTDSMRLVYSTNGQSGATKAGSAAEALKYNVLTTPRGGIYQLVLPDGSIAWLNAASSIRFPTTFAQDRRDVEITGEVYFDVHHNPSVPFYVHSPDAIVQVLGTEFNIQTYSNEPAALVTLLKGAVSVSQGNQPVVSSGLPGKHRFIEKVQLVPGQQARLFAGGNLKIEDKADVQQAIAWRSGFFKFNNAGIGSIMRAIERWYDIEISYQISDFSGTYGGRISRNLKLSELLRLLEGNNIHHYKMEGRKLIVLP